MRGIARANRKPVLVLGIDLMLAVRVQQGVRHAEHAVSSRYEPIKPIPSDDNFSQQAIDKHEVATRRGL